MYSIGDKSYPFNFTITSPYGTEIIKAIASTVPFEGTQDRIAQSPNLYIVGKANRENIRGILNRGLAVKAKKGRVAEAMCVYTIVKGL